MNNLTAQKATEILNRWIADCDRHDNPGNYEIRRVNSGERRQFASAFERNVQPRWVCVPAGSEFQARCGYRTLKDVLHRFGVPGF